MARVVDRHLDWSVTLELCSGRQVNLLPPLGKDSLAFFLIDQNEELSDFLKQVVILQEKIRPDQNLLDWDLEELEDLIQFSQEHFKILTLEDYYRAVFIICKERLDASLEYWDNQPVDKLLKCMDVAKKVHESRNKSMPKPRKPRRR